MFRDRKLPTADYRVFLLRDRNSSTSHCRVYFFRDRKLPIADYRVFLLRDSNSPTEHCRVYLFRDRKLPTADYRVYLLRDRKIIQSIQPLKLNSIRLSTLASNGYFDKQFVA